MKKTYYILVGTAKGLLIYEKGTDPLPELRSSHFIGFSVNMIYVDERTDRWGRNFTLVMMKVRPG